MEIHWQVQKLIEGNRVEVWVKWQIMPSMLCWETTKMAHVETWYCYWSCSISSVFSGYEGLFDTSSTVWWVVDAAIYNLKTKQPALTDYNSKYIEALSTCNSLAFSTTMPTHTIHSTLVSIYYATDGAPWNYLKWQETTGVGYGLFSSEDDQLLKNWTHQIAEDICSYFKMYKEKCKETDRMAFSSSRAAHISGLQFWRTWVHQLWKEKGMQFQITSEGCSTSGQKACSCSVVSLFTLVFIVSFVLSLFYCSSLLLFVYYYI